MKVVKFFNNYPNELECKAKLKEIREKQGADIAGGIHVFYYSEIMGKKVSFAFKGMKADFIKRAESDVTFESNQGQVIKAGILESIETGERVNKTILVTAFDSNNEVVATFEMISSLKVVV